MLEQSLLSSPTFWASVYSWFTPTVFLHRPPPHHRPPSSSNSRLSLGGSARKTPPAVEETFSLVSDSNPPAFSMIIRLAPDLIEEIKRVEAQGGTATMKYDANPNNPNGNIIDVGGKEFRFTWSKDGDLCDIYEQRQSGVDGNGLLVESGCAWRKVNVQRILDESTKNHVKMRSEEAERKLKSRKAIVLEPGNLSTQSNLKALVAVEATSWKNYSKKKEAAFKKKKAETLPVGGPPKTSNRSGLMSTTTTAKGKSYSPLTFKLLKHQPSFRCAIIMYQREFAMRLVALPGDKLYCRLTVNTQLHARISHLLKVGRNNFRPPPKVDSSVVRIEPRKPRIEVNQKEWDGFLRICFNRKNKTLGAIFRQKNVISMLEKNYKTVQALKISQEGSSMEADNKVDFSSFADFIDDQEMEVDDDGVDDDEDEMDVEDGGANGVQSEFKNKVLGVLKEGDFEEKRSSKLSLQEFLYLLSLFNKAGIHFT